MVNGWVRATGKGAGNIWGEVTWVSYSLQTKSCLVPRMANAFWCQNIEGFPKLVGKTLDMFKKKNWWNATLIN